MRCDQCQHWRAPGPDDDWNPIRKVFGECRQTPHTEDMMTWSDDEEWERVVKPEFADRTASAADASGYSAKLLTKHEHFLLDVPRKRKPRRLEWRRGVPYQTAFSAGLACSSVRK